MNSEKKALFASPFKYDFLCLFSKTTDVYSPAREVGSGKSDNILFQNKEKYEEQNEKSN